MIEPLAFNAAKCRRTAFAVLALAAVPILLAPPPAAAAASVQVGERTSYVLMSAGSRSSTMSGSMEDLARAKSLRSGSEGLLYVRDGGAAYVIRDSATLRQAEAIFAPQEALGARQAELGAQQAALGQRQARLGLEQGRLGRQQADASPSRAIELGRQQEALGRQQDALGREQDALGGRQDALGREQDRLSSIADGKIRGLVADAIRHGLAQRVD
jgi:bla regulator protein BlaR1